MAIRRSKLAHEGHFTQIKNSWARDKNLSLRARGLLIELTSHAEGWHATLESFISCRDGRDAVRAAVAELVDAGYLVVDQTRTSGKFGEVNYELQDPPLSAYPTTVQPTTAKPTLRILSTKNTKEKEQKEKTHTRVSNPAVPLPDSFKPTSNHLIKAAALGVDPAPLVDQMRRWAFANDVKRKNWNMVFNQFLANAKPSKPATATAGADLARMIDERDVFGIEKLTGVRCIYDPGEVSPAEATRLRREFVDDWLRDNRQLFFDSLPS